MDDEISSSSSSISCNQSNTTTNNNNNNNSHMTITAANNHHNSINCSLGPDASSDSEALYIRPLIKSDPRPADGANMALELRTAFRRHDKQVLLLDIANRVEWTGGDLLDRADRVATGLVKRLAVRPNDVIMTICEHTDMEILLALGIVFSGAALYGTQPTDGYSEAKVLCELVRPNVLVVQSDLHERAMALRKNVAGMGSVRIIWLDNPVAGLAPIRSNSINVNGRNQNCDLQHHLMMLARSRRKLSESDLDGNNNSDSNSNNNASTYKQENNNCSTYISSSSKFSSLFMPCNLIFYHFAEQS